MKILCSTGMPQTGKTTLINELIKIEGVKAIKIGEERECQTFVREL